MTLEKLLTLFLISAHPRGKYKVMLLLLHLSQGVVFSWSTLYILKRGDCNVLEQIATMLPCRTLASQE